MSKYKRDFYAIIFIIVLICTFSIPLFFPQLKFIVTPDFGTSDSFNGSISSEYIIWQSVQRHEIPYWTDQINNGFPFTGAMISPFYIPNIIAYLFLPFPLAYNLLLVWGILIYCLGFYLLIRSFRTHQSVAIFIAISAACSGMILLQTVHFTLFETLSLLPLVVWSSRLLQRKKSVLLSTGFILLQSQQILAGFPQTIIMTWILIFFVTFFYPSSKKSYIVHWVYLFLLMCIALAMSSCLLIPAYEYAKQTGNIALDPDTNTMFSFPFKHLLTFINPFALGNPHDGTFPNFQQSKGNIFWENTAFFGIIPIIAAFLAGSFSTVRKTISQRSFIVCLCITLFGLLLMTGKYSPFYFVHTFWPLSTFRVPSRFVWIFTIGILLLIQFLLQGMYNVQTKKKYFILLLLTGTILNIGHLYYVWWDNYHRLDDARIWLQKPDIVSTISPQDNILPLGGDQLYSVEFNNIPRLNRDSYRSWKNVLFPNSNALYGIRTDVAAAGRDLFRTKISHMMINGDLTLGTDPQSFDASVNAGFIHKLKVFGITKLITPYNISGIETVSSRQTFKFSNDHQLNIYTIQKPSPGYFASNTITLQSLSDFASYYSSQKVYEDTIAFIEDPDTSIKNLSTNSIASVLLDSPMHKVIEVKNNDSNEAFFVFNNYYYPGWIAKINNQPVTIYPANIRLKGVYIPPGISKIDFEYHPWWLYPSIGISVSLYAIVTGSFLYTLFKFIQRDKV